MAGNIQYSYDEEVGTEFDMDRIVAAVKGVTSGQEASVGEPVASEL